MFTKTVDTIFALQEAFARIGHELSADHVLYWSRNADLLEDLLAKIGKIEFLKEGRKTKILPELGVAQSEKVFSRGRPFRSCSFGSSRVSLHTEYGATPPVEAFSCTIGCWLTPAELRKCIAKDYILNESVWTPQQIKWMALEQNQKDLGDFLVFDRPNYFPIKNEKGKIVFCGLMWNDNFSFSRNPKNKWDYFYRDDEDDYQTQKHKYLSQGGQLILPREFSG